MYIEAAGKYYFHHIKDEIEHTDPNVPNYSEYLSLTGKKHLTIKKYISAIHKYWLYALYNQSSDGETFFHYIARYRKLLEVGFQIQEKCFSLLASETFYITTDSYKSLQNTNIDFIALESFYKFITDENINPLYRELDNKNINLHYKQLNTEKMKIADKHSKGSGYGLQAKGIMRQALMERLTVFSNFSNSKTNKFSTPKKDDTFIFPYNAFKLLLQEARDNPRRRLLYLLCGGTSARRGQALNLTRWDIDLYEKKVYLIDPLSKRFPKGNDGGALFGQLPRFDMLLKYNINPNLKPHVDIAFKYPIPTVTASEQSLHFFADNYRDLFFETYIELKGTLDNSNPFIFQTNTGGRADPSNLSKEIKKDLLALKRKYPELKIPKLSNVFHSFRHMYGQVMANQAYFISAKSKSNGLYMTPHNKIENIVDMWQLFTAHCMGHNSIKSTERYFNPNQYIRDFAIELIKDNIYEFERLNNRLIDSIQISELDSLTTDKT